MIWFEERLQPQDAPDGVIVNLIGNYDGGKVSIIVEIDGERHETFEKYMNGDDAESEDFMCKFGNKMHKFKKMNFHGILSVTGMLHDSDNLNSWLKSYRDRSVVKPTSIEGADAVEDG